MAPVFEVAFYLGSKKSKTVWQKNKYTTGGNTKIWKDWGIFTFIIVYFYFGCRFMSTILTNIFFFWSSGNDSVPHCPSSQSGLVVLITWGCLKELMLYAHPNYEIRFPATLKVSNVTSSSHIFLFKHFSLYFLSKYWKGMKRKTAILSDSSWLIKPVWCFFSNSNGCLLFSI